MEIDFAPPDLRSAAMQIEHYAREHGLSPSAVCDIFSVGIAAAKILTPPTRSPESAPKSVNRR